MCFLLQWLKYNYYGTNPVAAVKQSTYHHIPPATMSQKREKIRSKSLSMTGVHEAPTDVRDKASFDSPPDRVEQERQAKTARENQQILLYIFVSIVIAIAYILGNFDFSFLWVFFLIIITFLIWWGKVISLTEEHIKHQEVILHRRRALRHSETTEWLNFAINRWWVFSSTSLSDLLKRSLDPLLDTVKPAFIETIELHSFTVGESTPFIKYVKVFECATDGTKKPLSWTSFGTAPPGLSHAQQYQVVIEADVGMNSEDFKMVFRTRLGGKWMGMNLDVAVEKLNISGKMQIVYHFNMDTAFPHVSLVTISFLEKPEVWFAIRLLKAVQMMEIPVLKSWIHSLVMDGLTQALVDPGKVDIRVEPTGPTYAPAKSRSKAKASGVLTVTVSSDHSKTSVFSDDIRYCVLRVGEQKQHTHQTQGPGAWQDTCSFLIDDLTTDKLLIKSKSKRLLSTYTICQFDLPLADFPLEQKHILEHSMEEKVSKWQSGTVKLDLTLEYTKLPSIDTEVERESDKPTGAVLQTAGVMYVCVHSATNLLALDRNGTSDPYCIIFNNGKKIKTTHYVCRSRNPTWEVSTEFIVGDFTKTMLSFLVYDWDGHHASEDDFLGSAYIVLTPDESKVIKRNLTLGYNLLNVGQVDNLKLGAIQVTAIFRPVNSVAKSGTHYTEEGSNVAKNVSYHEHQVKSKNFMTSATNQIAELTSAVKNKLVGGKDSKVGDLLSQGYGILELNIMRGKDLVPMDSNGYSDPFCEVRVADERKFTTNVKKKTLNPVWDEWVTMQLPKPHETLDIVMWDRDPFFQKDFLGSLSFNLEELKKYSKNPPNDGWFQLQRIRSGYIQLHFKVITEEAGNQEGDGQWCSESTDSGLPHSANSSPREAELHDPPTSQANGHRVAALSPGNMSPIAETRVEAPGIRLQKDDGEEDEVFNTPGESEKPSPNTATQSHRLAPGTASARPGRKKFSFRLQRSHSDQDLKEAPKDRPLSLDSKLATKNLKRTDSSSTIGESLFDVPLEPSGSVSPSGAKYYGVRGHVIRGSGLQAVPGQVYCKVRIDRRTLQERNLKLSYGRVLCKSASLDADSEPNFDLEFDIDNGRGISCDALLIFDIKTSRKEHLTTKGFTLSYLLADSTECTRWLVLDRGIQVEVYLSQGNPAQPESHPKGLLGLVRNRKKIKET